MFERSLNEKSKLIEWPMVAALCGLMVLGAAFIYSAMPGSESTPWYREYFVRQILFYLLGIGAAIGFCLVDYHRWSRWSMVAYWFSIILLILVLIPGIGSAAGGARRWFDLGLIKVQPSEFAKLAFIFAQAHYLSRPVEELRSQTLFWKAIGMTALPFLLILKEPDLGSSLVFFPIVLVMMLVAGVPVRYMAKLVGGTTLLIAVLVVDVLFAPIGIVKLEEYQRHRLLVYFGTDFAPPDATAAERQRLQALQRERSYNIKQALISVGSGGMTGKGWRQGTQNTLGFLPRGVAHNDFIFSVIAEEKGFLGSVIVIALYLVVLFSGIKIASQARDRLGTLLAVGAVALLFSHVFINIGMNIRLMPVTGLPLPLLSYGGSSVLCSLVAAGMLQNIYIHRRSY